MKTLYDVQAKDGYHPEIGLLLSAMEDSTREWREHLGQPSIEAIQWQPIRDGHSIGALILHLIDCEVGWFENFLAEMPRDPAEDVLLMSNDVRQGEGIWPVPPAQPIEWYFGLHDRFRERAFAALKGLDPNRLYERSEYDCTLRWVVAHVLEHDSYTGGQAVVLHEMWLKQHG